MIINNSNTKMLDDIIRINDSIYLPISDMEIVYNIKTSYNKDTKRVVIDDLSKGMIKAIASEDTDIKFRPRRWSKDIDTLKQGETVYCFYTTSKGWRKIRTTKGIIGYIKANKLTNEFIVRQDMENTIEAKSIQKNDYNSKAFQIYENDLVKRIILKNTFSINNDNVEVSDLVENNDTNNKIWVEVTNTALGNRTESVLKDYKLRTKMIDMIFTKVIENEVNGICLNFNNIQDVKTMQRFVIELAPKLREIGITTCVVLNDNMDQQDYINIVDYIVK